MKSKLLKSIFISLILVMGVSNAWAATIFNCGIEVNETWYKGTGTINSKHWLEDKTDFSNKDFGVLTSIKLGGHYDTWDNNKEDYCGWNPNNGITITIKNGSTQKDQFRLSCFHSAKDGNNNIWETMGTINECSDEESSTYGRYTHDISKYTAGAYTIEAKWMSPSSISNTATAKFTIPGFTTTSKSQAFDNTQVNNSSSKTISFGTHYGTALKTSNCSISGTNASEFSVTSINESGVTVQFKPISAGDKTATLTITDAHSKKCTITLSGHAQSPTPSITISTTQQYLQIGEDKLTLTINYTNIPEGHCYRVKVGDGYYNGNAKGENNDHVSISGNGSVAFTTYSTLPGGTQSIVAELWKLNPFGATSTKSDAINVTVEQGYQVSIYTRIGSTDTPAGTISPTEHIGKTITATEMPGYTFTGWTSNTDNITFEDASAPSTLVYAKSGGQIFANYEKENCVYFINTSNWGEVAVYAWNGGGEQKNAEWPGVAMTKTGEKIYGYDVYKYCPIESYDYLIFNNNNNRQQTGDLVWVDGKYYCTFGVHGNFFANNEWKTTNFSSVSNDRTSASLTLNINAGSYEFGMKVPDLTSNSRSFSRENNSYTISGSSGNCNFNADITGEYTFTWTFATNTLTITYPQLVTYTVTFDMKGHGTQIEQIEVNKDSKITKPEDPTATGYTFGGWYKEVGCTNVFDFNTAINEDITLYANWTPTIYTITYKDKGGETFSGVHEDGYPTQHTYATDTQLKGAGKMGYTFLGWFTNKECTEGPITTLGATAYTANITLYAKWETRNLYIHADFVNNWGTPAQMTQDENNKAVYTYTTTLEAKAGSQASPYNEGYHFHFVNTDAADPNDNKAYTYYDVQTPTGTNIDGPHLTDPGNTTIQFGLARKSEVTITLTLQSPNDDPKPTVEINANPYYTITHSNPTNGNYTIKVGTNEPTNTDTESFADKTITLSANPNPGYHFVEWTVTKAGGGTITVTDDKFTMPAEDVTVAATFAATTYNITYHLNGGEGAANSTYTVESAGITLPIPTKTGYTFGGWFDNENCTGTAITTIAAGSTEDKTFYAKWTEIKYTVNISTDGNGSVSPSGEQQIGILGLEVTATPTDPSKFRFTKWEVSGGAQVADNYGATTTITATAEGTVIAHFEELQPKTIYLKTVEGTTDGVTWHVKYNDREYLMDELGCTNEYYKGVVPEGTSFQFVSRDASNNIVETKGTDLQYVEGKTLYNLVSLSAGGNKIFFKPNQQWIDKASNNNYYFAGHFWTGSHVWKQMTDDNRDGIYDCEKPTNGNEVIFCLVETTNNIENWENDWSHTIIQTDGNNAYKQIPNGSNLFTITDNKEKNNTGTWSTHADTPVNGDGEWTTFTGITYRITFDQQEATTAGTTHVDVAYHASMPEIEKLPAKNEKKFGGYYTEEDGQGVMLVNAFGEWQDANGYISSTTWEREECVTLYAYWKELTPEITDVTLNAEIFEPVDENQEGFVTADPTIDEHNNTTLTYVVCWKLLYTNGREVEGYDAIDTDGNAGNKVQFSIAGLATGTYTIRASLHTGNACGSGDEISRFDKQFSIVANRIITVNYTCDGNTIMASTKQNAHVINETKIQAPDIVGYTFKEWVAGDGVVISSTNGNSVTFTAYYDGNLTATYTKKKMVYFYNTMGWDNVYVYFYSSDKYWDNNMGSGSDKDKEIDGTKAHWFGYRGKMKQIQGTNIWYFDYLSLGGEIEGYTNVVFNKYKQDNYEWFSNTEVVRRGDMDADKLPMFVPIKGQNPEQKNNNTKYYNKGYWMNYPENTGYKLQIYDGTGNGAKEVASVRFPYSTNTIMPLTVSVDLEAGKTYGFKILREDNTYFSNSGTMTANSNGWSFTYGIDQNCGLKTTLAGDYTFTLKYTTPDKNDPNKYEYCVDVVYPVSVGDYRVIYKDNAKWSQTTAHGDNWHHPSYAIKKNSSNTEEKTDIVSFFIAKDNNPTMKFQKCTAINEQTVTWTDVANMEIPNDVVTAAGVYNFIVKQPAGGASISVESVEPYTGNYYIRVDAMNGKWGNYKTDPDNRMTYSAFSESKENSFGEKFSHYKTKWCEEGTNVKFTIANDYSPCISDTLIQDNGNPFNNIDIDGNLTSNNKKNAANIRFMWNRHTNKISRAYVAGSTFTDRQFLILKANKEIKNSSGGSLSNAGDNHNAYQAIFGDTQNWIYERTIQVQPETRVKLYACYPEVNVANAQYFRGTYDNNNATWNDDNSVQILGGTGASWNTIRIIYDFKTNRLMAAWVPTGEITGEKSLEADMMILREHQEDAACITFADSDDKLVNIKTVYGVLRLNKYILNNKKTTGNHEILAPKDQKSTYERALYFISFPFDVHLSDVFGFGTYGTHWVISEYNGLRRAKNGYFIDNCMNEDCTNWDYIWDPSNFTMKANQGYLLSLDLDLMKDNNESFWAHGINTVELYFPSYAHVQTIGQTSYTMPALGEEYICKHKGHEVLDTYWRCIGVPSFADYNSALTNGTNNITWQPKGSEFPFLYEWNVSDNSLMVQATSTYRFRPTYAYLVQNGNQIHWSAVNTTPNPSNIVARRQAPGEINNYEWKLTLSRNEQIEDQVFVRLSDNEQITTEFDFNQDLSKEFNYGRSDIYTLIGNTKAAANSLPLSEQTTLIPLGLSIEYNGDYTIAMPDRMENIGVTLIDTESNTRTNLSAGMEYTLTLNKGDYNNRFFIEISPAHQVPTDIDYIIGDSNNQDSVRKVLIDNILYIVRDGQMFDARGARVQ